MTHVNVKPNPKLDPRAWPLLKHPVSGGLLDATGEVPAEGRPWLLDGVTARHLTDGDILHADDPVFAQTDGDEDEPADDKLAKDEPANNKSADAPQRSPEPPKPLLPPALPAKSGADAAA